MSYTMIDFFAGIGGFTLGFEAAGFECIGHCEIDRFARRSYTAIHGERKGAWFADDITTVRPEDVPKCDLITAGFPCQDISVSGHRSGLQGARSSLFFEIIRIIQGKEPADRPRWVVLENVKNLLSINRGWDFATILAALAESGYDVEYQLLNSKHFGVPQNRERVFLVGHLRGQGGGKIFPLTGTDGKNIIRLIAGRQGERVYDPAGAGIALTAQSGAKAGGLYAVSYNRKDGVTGQLDTTHALTASDYRGINRNQRQNAVFIDLAKHEIAFPILNPDREKSRQNGRRIKEAEDPMFTLTTCDRHGVVLAPGAEHALPGLTGCRIRKLTPRECWRLQGIPDALFERAAAINSDTQLYKQAGNGVTVTVIYAIAQKLAESGARGA